MGMRTATTTMDGFCTLEPTTTQETIAQSAINPPPSFVPLGSTHTPSNMLGTIVAFVHATESGVLSPINRPSSSLVSFSFSVSVSSLPRSCSS